MNAPAVILDVVAAAVGKYPDSVDASVDWAVAKITKLPEYETFIGGLVRTAIRGIIGDYRHTNNNALRNERGDFDTKSKITVGETVDAIVRSVYDYFIAGRTLGSLLGKELPEIAANEAAKAEGHMFNSRLCTELKKLVPDDKLVRNAVKESKLRKLFDDLKQLASPVETENRYELLNHAGRLRA